MNTYHAAARHPPSNRLAGMLEAVKAEFENVTQEASAYKTYKDDYEHKSINRKGVLCLTCSNLTNSGDAKCTSNCL